MNQNPDLPQVDEREEVEKLSCKTDWAPLSADIRALPSVQNQIAERAYQIYLETGLPDHAALEHWLAAEDEARIWIYNAITCMAGPDENITPNTAGDR